MNKQIVRAAFAAVLLSSTASVALVSVPAAAAEKDKKPPEKSISKSLIKPMVAVQKAVQANDWQAAMASLKEAQATPGRTPFDDYKIAQFMAFAAVNLKDYPAAIVAYEAMAASPEEDPAEKASTRHNLILLNYDAKDYAKTLKYGEELAAMGPVDLKVTTTMAQAYYFSNNYPKAEEWSRKAVDSAIAAKTPPDQGALSVLLSAQAKQGKQAGAAQTLELIATNYGKPKDWSQLIDLALGTPGIQNADGIDLYRLSDFAGAMKDADDYALMATIALQLGFPGEAKTILDQGVREGRITTTGKAASQYKSASAGAASDDKTLPTFAKDAAARKTGDYDEKLAETYYGYKRYADAESAARRALSKPGGKDPMQAKMVLGMSLARLGKFDEAITVFNEVEQAPGRAARVKAAHLWASYCKSKVVHAAEAAPAAPAAQPEPAPAQQ
ncbi:MAG TPA: tetratricopeptide repeat protein [Rhizomicrobium sp.]|nr:tetratricopeptide repeat protein [Rhizomicrobium sp.]